MFRGIDGFLHLNASKSTVFDSAEGRAARVRHRREHPTEIGCGGCSDGRVDIAAATMTVPGVIQKWRNIGAVLDLTWPLFNNSLCAWQQHGLKCGKGGIWLSLFHGSESDNATLGCAGHNCDRDASFRVVEDLTRACHQVLKFPQYYPLTAGYDTDYHGLTLYGQAGESLNIFRDIFSREMISGWLSQHHPEMPVLSRQDLVDLCWRNRAYSTTLRATGQPIEKIRHLERAILIGRDFDWLHEPNTALIINTHDPDFVKGAIKAAGLVLKNLRDGVIDSDGIILVTSVPYDDGADRRFKAVKAENYHRMVEVAIREQVPELWPYLNRLCAVSNLHTRRIEVLHRHDARPGMVLS